MNTSDVDNLAAAFRQWPKDPAVFQLYDREVVSGVRDVVVACVDGAPIGYVTIKWVSDYPPFLEAGIPEVSDLNVLPAHRREGVGTRLLNEAEERIARRSRIVGIGVGLYRDYGSAQRLYVARGYMPDGNGIVVNGELVEPGSSIIIDDSPALMFTKQI